MKSKENEILSVNEKENWGNLVDPHGHAAAIGARLCDNRTRELHSFHDRRTVVGEKAVAMKLLKWLLSRKTLNDIRKNTSFSRGLDDRNCWATRYVIGKDGDLEVTLDVTCSGEYCYVRAYADRMPSCRLGVEPASDMDGNRCWVAILPEMGVRGPYIYADSKVDAMKMLLEYLANELVAADPIGEQDG